MKNKLTAACECLKKEHINKAREINSRLTAKLQSTLFILILILSLASCKKEIPEPCFSNQYNYKQGTIYIKAIESHFTYAYQVSVVNTPFKISGYLISDAKYCINDTLNRLDMTKHEMIYLSKY
jgi:hypothetical protein